MEWRPAARILGWLLALLLLFAAGRAAFGLQQRFAGQDTVTARRTLDFVSRVRACRRAPPGPPPSWEQCEAAVRAQDWQATKSLRP